MERKDEKHMTVVEIGRVRFAVSCDLPIANDDLPASYRNFLIPDSGADCAPTVDVRVIPDLPPLPSNAQPLTIGEAWSMFSDGTDRRLVWHSPKSNDPVWHATLDANAERVTVYCGPRLLRSEGGRTVVRNPLRYPLDQILMMYFLARRGGVIVHSAGLSAGGRGLLCAGRSRAGKSTLARLWREHARGELLSDDRIVVRAARDSNVRPSSFTLFGTPWPGTLGVASAEAARAVAVLFLQHGDENRLVALSSTQALERLLPVVSIPWFDPELLPAALGVCEQVAMGLPAYDFFFTPDKRAVEPLHKLLARGPSTR